MGRGMFILFWVQAQQTKACLGFWFGGLIADWGSKCWLRKIFGGVTPPSTPTPFATALSWAIYVTSQLRTAHFVEVVYTEWLQLNLNTYIDHSMSPLHSIPSSPYLIREMVKFKLEFCAYCRRDSQWLESNSSNLNLEYCLWRDK